MWYYVSAQCPGYRIWFAHLWQISSQSCKTICFCHQGVKEAVFFLCCWETFSLRDQGNTSEEKITHICPSATKMVVFCLSRVEAFPVLHLSKKLNKCSYATSAVSVLWFPPYQSDLNLVVEGALVQSSAEFGGPSSSLCGHVPIL